LEIEKEKVMAKIKVVFMTCFVEAPGITTLEVSEILTCYTNTTFGVFFTVQAWHGSLGPG
jgi:hypothetical protein